MPRGINAYLVFMCVIGTILPWAHFIVYFTNEPSNLINIITNIFPNPLASGFTTDLLISIMVLLVWTYFDIGRQNIKKWLLLVFSTCFVGLSLSLPLYLLMKHAEYCREHSFE